MGGASEWGGAYMLLLPYMLNSYYAVEESVAQHRCHCDQHRQQLLASLVWLVVNVAPLRCAGHRTTDALCKQNRHKHEDSMTPILQTEQWTFCSLQALNIVVVGLTFTLAGEVQAQDVTAKCVQVVQILQVLLHSAVRQPDLNKRS